MSSGVRVVPEDELAYARERVISWCTKQYPHMTLGQVQHLAILLAVERQKAIQVAVIAALPARTRRHRLEMPITLPAEPDVINEDEDTEPRTKK